MIKTFSLLFLLASLSLFGFTIKNFSKNGIDYQWDRCDKQDAAIHVYVKGFQDAYMRLGLGDCEEHFKMQVTEEKRLHDNDPHNNRWLVAMDGDKVVGMAIFELNNYPNIYIRELSVLPEYRRQGIGKELTTALLQDNPIKCISIVARRVNKPALEFYKALNFKESGFQHSGYDPKKYIGMELFP